MSDERGLAIHDLSVRYDGRRALSAVTLAVAPGEVLALLGPSGAGKSTLLHAVAGFVAPEHGEVRIDGRPVATPRHVLPANQRDVAVVFQSYALWPHLTALDTVAYPARRRGLGREKARAEARELLDRLHIAHLADRRPGELSGGEQQRVGLARALARHASVYLFDEPTAHLDTHLRSLFLEELVARQRTTGAAAVYATHDAQEALGLADTVALFDAGRVVQVGTPRQVYDEPVDRWAARLTGPASVIAAPDGGQLLVRPEWACLDAADPVGKASSGVVRDVRFRGPHSDFLLETGVGRLLVREPGPPVHRVGDEVTWTLRRSWCLDPPDGDRAGQPTTSRT